MYKNTNTDKKMLVKAKYTHLSPTATTRFFRMLSVEFIPAVWFGIQFQRIGLTVNAQFTWNKNKNRRSSVCLHIGSFYLHALQVYWCLFTNWNQTPAFVFDTHTHARTQALTDLHTHTSIDSIDSTHSNVSVHNVVWHR